MKHTFLMKVFIILVMIFSLVGCSEPQYENDTPPDILNTEQTEQAEQTEEAEEVVQRPEITRLNGYNSVLISFIDLKSQNGLDMDVDINSIESTSTHKKYSFEEASSADILLDYNNSLDEYAFLLKEGYKLSAIMNPHNRNSLDGWEDYKANYPFEVTAIKEANNQLNIFDITIDYSSSIVSTDVETSISK